uniref:Cytochrome P450 n=1 Tax=Brassica campestris TaxID=3711 RepID=M4DNI2_BRACM
MQMMIVLLLLCSTIFITILFFQKQTARRKSNTPPPSPPRLPFIGNLHQLGRYPHRSLCFLSRRYGPLMILHFGRVPVLVVSSVGAARDVLKTHDRVFASRPQSKIFEKLMYNGRDVAVAPYGEYWRQMKSVCVLHLLSHKMEEVRTCCKRRSSVSEEDLQNMKYLKAVIKETLRLHPPLPLLVPHKSTQEVILRDYGIPAGTQVTINAWAIGREAATWGQDAESFRPERHLDSSVDFRGHDFELIPFGAGRRICPAISFAAVLNEFVLANLVHQLNWRLPAESNEVKTNVAESIGTVIHRMFPLYAIASSTT